jgi:hypothetical protein
MLRFGTSGASGLNSAGSSARLKSYGAIRPPSTFVKRLFCLTRAMKSTNARAASLFDESALTPMPLPGNVVIHVDAAVSPGRAKIDESIFGFAATALPKIAEKPIDMSACSLPYWAITCGSPSAAAEGAKQPASFIATKCWSALRQPGELANDARPLAFFAFQPGSLA